MPRLQGFCIAGAPVPCAECRTPFTPCAVSWTKRSSASLMCPRCLKVKKTAKQQKKAKKKK